MNTAKLLRSSALTIVIVAFTLAYSEAFVRIFSPQPLMPRYITGTAWGVRGNIPGARYRHVTPEVNVEYRINSKGLRSDREFSVSKPAGVCRVALFGDSFFVGYELNLPDTMATQLESTLRSHGINVEVLNFAVSGFGTAEMLRTYEGFASSYQPDVVIFEWHSSDIVDNVRANLFRLEEGRSLRKVAASYLPSVKTQDFLMRSSAYRFVADNSQLYSLFREKAALMVKDALYSLHRGHKKRSGNGEAIAEGLRGDRYALSAAILRKAAEEVSSRNALFIVAEVPDRNPKGTIDSTWSLVKDRGAGGIDFVSPLDDFRAEASGSVKLYFEKGHGHLTPHGARLLSEHIAGWIIDRQQSLACNNPRGN